MTEENTDKVKKQQETLKRNVRALTGAAWFWWILLAVALAAAVGYLKVTLLAPLGGDDQINNLRAYYELTHSSVWELMKQEAAGIWKALTLQNSRFFPFSTLPVPLRYWFKGNIDRYRLFIIGHTLVDAALLGLLVTKATGRKRLGGALFALLPLMLCLWTDWSSNGMFSYEALPQMALCPALLAGLCMVALHKTGHWRWGVLGALLTFWTCGTYEIGYTYILMLGFLALVLEPRFWKAVRLGLPFLGGEVAALCLYVMSSRLNTSAGSQSYAGVQASFDLKEIALTWVQQMSAGFPLKTILLSDYHPTSYTAGDFFWPLVLAAVVVCFLWLGRPEPDKRQSVFLFLMGLSMLAGPAFLVGLSGKYQDGWVTWTTAYIPAAVESFGVALMVLVVLVWLFRLVRGSRYARWGMVVLAVVVILGLTACGAYQRAATRQHNGTEKRATYEFLCDSVEAGLAADVPQDSPLVCEFNVWGSDKGAQEAFFLRYGDCSRNAYHVDAWENDPQPNGEPIYFLCYARDYEGYDVAWVAHVTDDMTRYADSVKVYIQGDKVPADAILSYITLGEDGSEVWHEACLQDLPRTEPDENGDYFVTVRDDNIISRRISLWP